MSKELSNVVKRFLKYVSVDTRSRDDADAIPSTQKQFDLARLIAAEMKELGLENVKLDEHCYVYGYVPATDPSLPTLGFIAHMDTVEWKGEQCVLPRIVENYPGGDIYLNPSVAIEEDKFPYLNGLIGQDIIVTDGTTVLGADDKAGVAEIMTLAEMLINDKSIRHGRIAIGFTPDEEVGNGATMFDVKGFGADFAYTVDGGPIGEIEYENFNAATARVTVRGRNIHPGAAKGKMVNSAHVFKEFDALLPALERPEHTEGYEGFFHLEHMQGNVEETKAIYIIRDHDMARFTQRKELMQRAAGFINNRYGEGTLLLKLKDSYYNMKEKILPHMHLIDTARTAMQALGITPEIVPIRGGTDGARLSYMGLPCPNLCTGGYNCHGPREFIPVQSLEKMCELLREIVIRTYGNR
ncbi:MAG: peptidase T [Christensenellales bacterium]